MEIGPVANVRPLPAIKVKGAAQELPAVFEIEYLGRTDDETYSAAGGKAASGYEDEDANLADGVEQELPERTAENGPGRQISFFA